MISGIIVPKILSVFQPKFEKCSFWIFSESNEKRLPIFQKTDKFDSSEFYSKIDSLYK